MLSDNDERTLKCLPAVRALWDLRHSGQVPQTHVFEHVSRMVAELHEVSGRGEDLRSEDLVVLDAQATQNVTGDVHASRATLVIQPRQWFGINAASDCLVCHP